MYSRIVCAIDGSDLSTKALRHALALARTLEASLTVITVTEPSVIIAPGAEIMMVDTSSMIADLDAAKAESARTILAAAQQEAQSADIAIATRHIADLPPADGIEKAAREQNANLIIMGSHGRRGLGRLLLGSQAAEVLAHSDIPVLIVK